MLMALPQERPATSAADDFSASRRETGWNMIRKSVAVFRMDMLKQ
ncbi:hypothetical protein [Bradyrhizobium sp. CB1015]|nr:hypothetical protein [Bradyrhizobium sp. CB1015]UWU90275.1 hypothetical protein N2604_27915 [Bradyrhizobium sp. CB1015]